MKYIRTYFGEFIITLIGLVVYTLVLFKLNMGINDSIMFSTPDSQSYLDVMKWFKDGSINDSLAIRPILYPLILLFTYSIIGVKGIWLVQVLMWVTTLNLVYATVKKMTNHIIFPILASIIFVSNLSLITLTLHGLTEVTTSFLLAGFVFFIVTKINRKNEIYFIQGVILFLVLLTILKPVFYLPLVFTLFVPLPLFYLKEYLKRPTQLLKLMVILIPLFIQIGIMIVNFGVFKVSKISSVTLTEYILAQGLMDEEGISRPDAIIRANSLLRADKINFIWSHKLTFLNIYVDNVKNNIDAEATLLLYPTGYGNNKLKTYMDTLNGIYYYLHIAFIFIISLICIITLKNKDYKKLTILTILSVITAYYILATGVSYLQGDRLVLPIISIWSILYILCISSLLSIKPKNVS